MTYEKLYELRQTLRPTTKDGLYTDNEKNREILTVRWSGNTENPKNFSAVTIGINPSKANDERSDKTLTQLARFLDMYGFTNFKMLNIFSSYSTQQTGIRTNTQTDFSKFKGCLKDADIIILAWGTDRGAYKDEKNRILEFLKAEKFMEKVFCISETGNSSDTRHPSRISYSYQLVQFEESA
ncbi:DUF1643 domain-containing protein [Neisseria lactamica]|uniref:DUF1643 domain-containing protein n=1 Tax=Neisseria lactamica TaxID=486 RepID=UPI000E592E39|nr:DUF1643 domain-containing protein [Neisseria lactamica]